MELAQIKTDRTQFSGEIYCDARVHTQNKRCEIDGAAKQLVQTSVSVLREHFESRANALCDANPDNNKKSIRSQISVLNNQISKMQTENDTLSARIRNLEEVVDNETRQRIVNENEILRLRDGIKGQKLFIAGEEQRFTPQEFPKSVRSGVASKMDRSTLLGNIKRKRTTHDEIEDYYLPLALESEIAIIESCPHGNFLKLYNKSDAEVEITFGASLQKRQRKTVDNESFYASHHSVKIQPKSVVMVRSIGTVKHIVPMGHIAIEDAGPCNIRARENIRSSASSSENIGKNENKMCALM